MANNKNARKKRKIVQKTSRISLLRQCERNDTSEEETEDRMEGMKKYTLDIFKR